MNDRTKVGQPAMSPPESATRRFEPRVHESENVGLQRDRDIHDEVDASGFDTDWEARLTTDAPPPRPGFRQRWCRIPTDKDGQRLQRKHARTGYLPRLVDDEILNYFPTLAAGTRGAGSKIIVDGVMLMECPIDRIESRDRWLKMKNAEQMRSIGGTVRDTAQKGGVPIEESYTSNVIHGSRPPVQSD